jgi:hypothetical protein
MTQLLIIVKVKRYLMGFIMLMIELIHLKVMNMFMSLLNKEEISIKVSRKTNLSFCKHLKVDSHRKRVLKELPRKSIYKKI